MPNPLISHNKESWPIFLQSIFYIGKGTRSRPFSHLYDAIKKYNKNKNCSKTLNEKTSKIHSIWREGLGVVCLQVFNNAIGVEALTREATMIQALGKLTISLHFSTGSVFLEVGKYCELFKLLIFLNVVFCLTEDSGTQII